jgi:hypothetical protein
MDLLFNTIWLTVITLTTVGYGDIAPSTIPGRFVAMVIALWGGFLISFLVVTVSSVFDLTNNQKMALRHIRQTRRAAVTISQGIKFFLVKKKYYLLMQRFNPRFRDNSPFLTLLCSTSKADRVMFLMKSK